MALTGHAAGMPLASPAGVFGLLADVTQSLAALTGVEADPGTLIAGRAALAGFHRGGQVSAGGSTRLLRAADGWCAVTLSRPADVESVPAILGLLDTPAPAAAGGHWAALAAAAAASPASAVADAAQLLGVPASVLPPVPAAAPWPPWQASRLAPRSAAGAPLASAVVVDLSSMWAGPLCGRLLGLAGGRVIKVESPDRPDGARSGNQAFYDWLHAGHEAIALDFRSAPGRDLLARLLAAADIVIEGSRPRALENLGLAPGMLAPRPGQVWLSITGYGRSVPDRVAFGDDAAIAGGLAGYDAAGQPVFCADAAADPLTGVCGALAVAQSRAAGGGELIDLPMQAVAAAFAAAPATCAGPHPVTPGGVTCQALGVTQPVAPPAAPQLPGGSAALGADTEAVASWLSASSSSR